MKYLLDTNICIFLLRGRRKIAEKIDEAGIENCCISEITKAELLLGLKLAGSRLSARTVDSTYAFINSMRTLPISQSIESFVDNKARLMKDGNVLEDFDLLIGCTAVSMNLIMVTDNISHLNQIEGIRIEDWARE